MVLIKKLQLNLVKIDEPEDFDFPDMADKDWFIEGSSTIESRVLLNFYFKPHCTTDLGQDFPVNILEC